MPRLLLLAVVLLPLAGCSDRDDIRSYTAPRPDEDVGTGNVRLLAAIVPAGKDTWFFKLVGRADVVQAVEPAWDALVSSLTLNEKADPAVSWKVPDKWTEARGTPPRIATIKPDGVPNLEIAVTKFAGTGGELKPNLDRWRRLDLGLNPIPSRAVEKVTRKKDVNGLPITLVDMRGPGVSKEAAGNLPPMHPPIGDRPDRTDTKGRKAPFNYKKPADWREAPGGMMTAASFTVGDGPRPARILVTPLAGTMPGGMIANVNRWRGEVELPAIKEADLANAGIRNVRVAGVEAKYVDLTGPTQRSLVVWLEHTGTTWFFKLIGPKDVVDKQRNNFDSFVQSVTFSGDAK